ncbi:hypothetical protein TNCT_245301 [Trichonephila clavata]|uniref:Uncharacterized protein n=1 Tax=Trichonephila clavata TaxID=2740835 RepID=A0A8X6F2D4_TRICU|nr:hypothetical protein TNCT_245301 [Trichonephila clavata]
MHSHPHHQTPIPTDASPPEVIPLLWRSIITFHRRRKEEKEHSSLSICHRGIRMMWNMESPVMEKCSSVNSPMMRRGFCVVSSKTMVKK